MKQEIVKPTHLDLVFIVWLCYTLETWKCTKLVDYLHLNCCDALTRRSNFLLTFYLLIFSFSLSTLFHCLYMCVCHQLSNILFIYIRCKRAKSIWFSWLITSYIVCATQIHTHWIRGRERKRNAHTHTYINGYTTEYKNENGKLYGWDRKCLFIRINLHIHLFSSCHTHIQCEMKFTWRHCIRYSFRFVHFYFLTHPISCFADTVVDGIIYYYYYYN